MAKSWEDGRWIVTLVSGDEYFVELDKEDPLGSLESSNWLKGENNDNNDNKHILLINPKSVITIRNYLGF